MLSAKEALLAELANVLLDSSMFFVGLSSDLSVRGAKYLTQASSVRGNSLSIDKTAVAVSMDKQYALVIAQDLVPHVLVCFEHIFMCPPPTPSSTTSSSTSASNEKGSKGRGKAVLLHVDNLLSARSAMGSSSHAALTACWTLFRKADLLPAERPLPLPLRQTTPTANTLNTVTSHGTESRSSPVDPAVTLADTVVAGQSGGIINNTEKDGDNQQRGGRIGGDDGGVYGGEGGGIVESAAVQDPESMLSSSHGTEE